MRNLRILLFLSCFTIHDTLLAISDTVFIKKQATKDFSHFIFWETNKQSRFYNYVADFTMNKFDKETYQRSLHESKQRKKNFTKPNYENLPKEWVILQVYQGKVCLYSPNDYYSHLKIKFTDNNMIYWSGEGPEAMQLTNFKKIDSASFSISTNARVKKLEINFINKEKGIAVFKFQEQFLLDKKLQTNIWYCIMCDVRKMRSIPFIVNYSENEKAYELDFDEVDFLTTIKNKKVTIIKDRTSK